MNPQAMSVQSPMMPSDVRSVHSFYNSESSGGSPVESPAESPKSAQSQPQQVERTSETYSDSHLAPLPSPYPAFTDPSPVDSNGTASTETTEIEDDDNADDEASDSRYQSPLVGFGSPVSPEALPGLDTALAARTRADSDAPQSVIHAPQDFKPWDAKRSSPEMKRHTSSSPTESTSKTVVSPESPPSAYGASSTRGAASKKGQQPPINTDVAPMTERLMPTPQAKTREEIENQWEDRQKSSTSLEGIPEGQDAEREDNDEDYEDAGEDRPTSASRVPEERLESVNSLKKALASAWDLCNNFSNLSSNHRNRIFNYRGKSGVQGQAWRSCWKLCQNLYDYREEDPEAQVVPTLELLRDFCQALFEARQKGDDAADSVLRVSFELNNHLYNTHDRNLPTAFQERTLDFYLTLCHRLMKQRTSLPVETDELLRACWTLAEMLFSIRQYNRDERAIDEEVLASALQACWQLCDMFRDGWTQIMPNRSTPRASQTTFAHSQVPFSSYPNTQSASSSSLTRSSASVSRSSSSVRSFKESRMKATTQAPPETPTTVFDDTNEAVDMDDHIPNILVLGPESSRASSNSSLHRHTNPNKWSSAASSFSESSQRTSSTATVSSSTINVARLRVLVVFVAKSSGFNPKQQLGPSSSASNASAASSYSPAQQNAALIAFVKGMPTQDFGDAAWERNLLDKYKKLVVGWPALATRYAKSDNGHLIQDTTRTVTHAECGRAVLWIMRIQQYEWVRDLFRKFIGTNPDEALKDLEDIIEG